MEAIMTLICLLPQVVDGLDLPRGPFAISLLGGGVVAALLVLRNSGSLKGAAIVGSVFFVLGIVVLTC